jgi:ABC-type oligopeptide transport system substrate-binding subunit
MSVGLRGKNYDMKYIYALLLIFFPLNAYAQSASIAMHGDAKYAQDFTHFEYVNPNAPKGGSFTEATIGTYDSLNGFITKGVAAANLGLLYQPLMIFEIWRNRAKCDRCTRWKISIICD